MALFNANLARTLVRNSKDALFANITNDTTFSQQLHAIRQWINDKKQKLIITEEVLGPMLSESSLLGDAVNLSFKNFDNPNDEVHVHSITKETFDNVMNSIDRANELSNSAFNESIPNSGVSLTDGSGYTYSLRIADVSITDTDGVVKSVHGLTTVTDPHDYHDMFLYNDGVNCKVNTIIKSMGYYRVGGQIHIFPTVMSMLDEFYDLREYRSIEDTILDKLKKISGSASSTIYGCMTTLCSDQQVVQTGVLYDDLLACLQVEIESHSLENYGIRRYIGDVLRATAVNNTIIDLFTKVCDSLFANKLKDGLETLRYHFNEFSSRVKDILNDISSAFNTGGFYGVICYFISIIKGENSIRNSGEQLSFTDNSTLAPAQYIAGIILTVVGYIAQVAAIIVTVISKVAGAIVMVIGNILLAIPKAFNWDWEQNTTAAVNSDDCYVFDCSPHAFAQYEVNLSQVDGAKENDIYQLIKDNASPVVAQVPGGYLFIGQGSSEYTLRFEFHPSCLVIKPTHVKALYSVRLVQEDNSWRTCINMKFTGDGCNPDKFFEAWAEDYASGFTVNNANNGVLSESDDLAVRNALMCNTSVFMMWLYLLVMRDMTTDLTDKILCLRYTDWDGSPVNRPWIDFTPDPDHFANIFAYIIYNDVTFYQSAIHNDSHVDAFAWAELVENFFSTVKATTEGIHVYGKLSATMSTYWSGNDVANVFNCAQTLKASQNREYSAYGDYNILPSEYRFYLSTPKYDRNTFMIWVAIATFVAVIAAVTTVVLTVKAKKWVQNKRARLTSQVSNNWENYSKAMKEYDPNDEEDDPSYHTPEARANAYNAYYKSVKQNNRWQMLLGGTKYSTAGYWDSDDSTTAESESSSSFFNSLKSDAGDSAETFNTKEDVETGFANDLLIYRVITGYNQ